MKSRDHKKKKKKKKSSKLEKTREKQKNAERNKCVGSNLFVVGFVCFFKVFSNLRSDTLSSVESYPGSSIDLLVLGKAIFTTC